MFAIFDIGGLVSHHIFLNLRMAFQIKYLKMSEIPVSELR